VRVPIPVPPSVLLCAYKLGFGLVQNFLKIFKIPSVWINGQFGVHRKLHSAMSGAPVGRA
jgi:superfamily I DNA and RNA helicase